MKLKEILETFNGGILDENQLNSKFKELAEVFLYGGYIKVREDFRIYIKTVEFYFHSEKTDGIKDSIVYHRNGRFMENVPYFPIGTLHAHQSGIDIAFENEKEEYRASALIRAYEVVTTKDNKFLKWDSKAGKFVSHKEYQYNNQSTYLYDILNGFAMGESSEIVWIDKERVQTKELIANTRKNVFKSECTTEYLPTKEKKCDREWSFTRDEEIEIK